MKACSERLPQQTLNLLTICRKAGKLILGFDPVRDAVKSKQAFCVLLAADASPKTAKEAVFFCGGVVPLYTVPVSAEALAGCFHRKVAVMAVCDAGFARRFGTLLPPPGGETSPQTL